MNCTVESQSQGCDLIYLREIRRLVIVQETYVELVLKITAPLPKISGNCFSFVL